MLGARRFTAADPVCCLDYGRMFLCVLQRRVVVRPQSFRWACSVGDLPTITAVGSCVIEEFFPRPAMLVLSFLAVVYCHHDDELAIGCGDVGPDVFGEGLGT